MENYISGQLVTFFRAALLGAVCGVIYDLLRALRLRRVRSRLLTHLLDVVYVVSAILALIFFMLRQGEGELRLYMLLAKFLGFVLYFLVFADILRPIWDFWSKTICTFMAVLWWPAAFVLRCGKNFQIYIKKLFYFWRKYATIEK